MKWCVRSAIRCRRARPDSRYTRDPWYVPTDCDDAWIFQDERVAEPEKSATVIEAEVFRDKV